MKPPLLTDARGLQGCLNSQNCTFVTVHVQKRGCEVPFSHSTIEIYCDYFVKLFFLLYIFLACTRQMPQNIDQFFTVVPFLYLYV